MNIPGFPLPIFTMERGDITAAMVPSFATHVLQKGADIYGVSKIMGHSTPVVTAEFYDHSTALNYLGVTDLL
jgi:site-specific recombinase XerC